MNTIPFREHHLFSLLEAYDKQSLPLDLLINQYFRQHPALGSKDRGFIAEAAYALIRWKGLLDYLTFNASWQKRYDLFTKIDVNEYIHHEEIPSHIRVSFPQSLFEILVNDFGEKKAMELCLICNSPAPTTVRANALKTTRDFLLEKWKSNYEVTPTKNAAHGIVFHKRINFFQLPEFKEGLFEVQDEGSQLLADLIQAKPGDLIMDYCSGSGGKTLAFAPILEKKGQIYLHDIRSYALLEARKRLKRAGVQNSQILQSDSPNLSKLKKKMDWVLVDAPCTGTGTLRRNPDMKWKFDEETLTRLCSTQRVIFEKALSYMHPKGRIVYATCSLLKKENQIQLEHFIKTYQLCLDHEPFQSLPNYGEMDGFFGVVLKRA
jgi:16S rRNA C967 or C1407 C5-methylase (RsmB/RsmF family)